MQIPVSRKVQTIADLIARRESDDSIAPDALGIPWVNYHTWIVDYVAGDEQYEAVKLLNDFYDRYVRSSEDDAAKERYQRIRHAITTPIRYPSAGEMLPGIPDLEWLWPEWLPKQMLILLAASPGTGKSYLVLNLMQAVINGSQFPDGTRVAQPGRVLYVDAENTPILFKQRVQLWSPRELERITLMLPTPPRLSINLDEEFDRERLRDMVWVLRPDLIVVDSYSRASARGENAKEDVQSLLAFLNQVVQDFYTTLIVIHHLRKPPGAQSSFMRMTYDSVRGSSHLVAMARLVMGMQIIPTTPTPDLNGPRELWVMKSNAAVYPDSLGVSFVPHPQCPDVAQLVYGDPPSPYQKPEKRDYCAEWLEDLLREAGEPMKPSEVVAIGEDEGYSQSTIYRTRRTLKQIQNTEDSARNSNNKWEWVE